MRASPLASQRELRVAGRSSQQGHRRGSRKVPELAAVLVLELAAALVLGQVARRARVGMEERGRGLAVRRW